MSKLLEAMAVLLWLAVIVNAVFLGLWRDNMVILWTALLFTLWALLYEARSRP
jgi:LPS O-antigen subunit length determinant protein (WzzB/FepE family)